MTQEKRLSDRVAEDIWKLIAVDKKFVPGDQLPNENELTTELNVSRTTLREALRIIVTNGILEIQRGKGTFVKTDVDIYQDMESFQDLTDDRMDAKDLYEIRLIFDPEAANYATLRASESELNRILEYGEQREEKIKRNEDRTEVEQEIHNAIAYAKSNEFIDKRKQVNYPAIDKVVVL